LRSHEAKTGVVVVGNEATLTMGTSDPGSAEFWKRLLNKMARAQLEPSQGGRKKGGAEPSDLGWTSV